MTHSRSTGYIGYSVICFQLAIATAITVTIARRFWAFTKTRLIIELTDLLLEISDHQAVGKPASAPAVLIIGQTKLGLEMNK